MGLEPLPVSFVPRQRLTCDQALAHPWMETVKTMDPRATKSLSKMKMKKFLARQKWQVSSVKQHEAETAASLVPSMLEYEIGNAFQIHGLHFQYQD